MEVLCGKLEGSYRNPGENSEILLRVKTVSLMVYRAGNGMWCCNVGARNKETKRVFFDIMFLYLLRILGHSNGFLVGVFSKSMIKTATFKSDVVNVLIIFSSRNVYFI